LVTDETPVTKQVPLYARQPVAKLSPPPKEEVAEPVVVRPFVEERPRVVMPPANVEVAVEVEVIEPNCPRPMSAVDAWRVVADERPPANVLVAVEVEVSDPVVILPEVSEEKVAVIERRMVAKSEVEVALVVVELANV
jgi:hypothetical protein